MKLLYIHGYNGDPCGESFKNLKTACADNHDLFTIDYTPDYPKNAIAEIASFVRGNKIDVVIGASLGGFLAMNLYGVSRIVVNPCWDPAKELPKLGYEGDIDMYSNLLNTMKDSLDFEEKNLCSGVFANEDELLGDRYIGEFQTYFKLHFHIEGGHRIDANMAKEIIENILPLHEEETSLYVKQLKEMDNAPWL